MAGPKKKSTRARSPRSKRQEDDQTAAKRDEDRDARAGGQAEVDGEDEHPPGDEGDGADADADLDDEVLVAEIVPAGEEVLDDEDPADIDSELDRLIDDPDQPRDEPDDDRELGPELGEENDPELGHARPPRGASSRAGIVRHDPLAAYIRETKRYPLLTREEEHDARGQAGRGRRSPPRPAPDRGQPAPGREDRLRVSPRLPQPARPRAGGQHRADAGRAQVRSRTAASSCRATRLRGSAPTSSSSSSTTGAW